MKHATDLVKRTANCAYCPTLCLHACPVATAEHTDVASPWGLMSLTRWLSTSKAVLNADSADVLFKCTGCGACTDACRHAVPVAETLRIARQDARAAGFGPLSAGDIDVPIESASAPTLPVGSSAYRLYFAGFRSEFEAAARTAATRWSQRSTLVFESAEDVRCVQEVYPTLGLTVPKAHLASERSAGRTALSGPVAYHEACHVARGEGIDGAAVRANVAACSDSPLIELRWHGKAATCCGGGGVYAQTSPDGAREAARRILQTAADRGAKTLATGCAGCASHLSANTDGIDIDVVVVEGA